MAPSRTEWFSLMGLFVSVFAMVVVEELPMGLNESMAADLNTTSGVIGQTVTLPALVAAVTAVTTPVLIGTIDRKYVLLGGLLAMSALSAATALSPSLWLIMACRTVVGVCIGSFWALAPTVAPRIAAPKDAERASSVVFSGGSTATVLGVPLATVLGVTLGWRWSFGALAGVGVFTAWWLAVSLPKLPAREQRWEFSTLVSALRHPVVGVGVLTTGVLVIGHYAAVMYVGPLLSAFAGVSEQHLGAFLMLLGASAIVGNFVIAAALRRFDTPALLAVPVGLCLALGSMPFVVTGWVQAAFFMVVWGICGGSMTTGVQVWMQRRCPDELEAATGWNAGVFNLSIGLGAGLGGWLIDHAAPQVLPMTAAAICVVGAVPLVWFFTSRHNTGRVPAAH